MGENGHREIYVNPIRYNYLIESDIEPHFYENQVEYNQDQPINH